MLRLAQDNPSVQNPASDASLLSAGQLAALSSPPGEGAADPLTEQRERWKAARARMGAPLTPKTPVARREPAEVVPLVSQNAAPVLRRGEWPDTEWFYHGMAPQVRGDTVREILRQTASEHGFHSSALTGKCRTKGIVVARYVAIHRIALRFPQMSSPQIGKIFDLDHTSVLFALGRLKRKPDVLPVVLAAVGEGSVRP